MGLSNYALVAHKSLFCGHLSVLEIYLMKFLPFRTSLEFLTQQYAYTHYKMMDFA